MSFTARLRTILLCSVLQLGVLFGVPMPPERIRELMQTMNQPKLAHVLPTKDDEGGDPPIDRGDEP